MPALDDRLKREMAVLANADQRRELKLTEFLSGVRVMREGRELISFSGNDYLGLSHHPAVMAAAEIALLKSGAGAGASRLITGNHPYYADLEARLAAMKATEAALVVGSGYLANLGAIPALVGKGDLILADRLVHACILDGAALSGAVFKRFKHNDMEDLERILMKYRREHNQCLVVTDHVFSMDGDVAPLVKMRALCDAHDAILMADDAHGLGIVDPAATPDIWMGTLSKTAGGYGGYLAGSRVLIDYLISTMRSFVFSTALPPSVIAAADAALKMMTPVLCARPLFLARRFTAALNLANAQSAIVPVILGDAARALEASRKLEARGFLVSAIRPPTVPQGSARLRVTVSAQHDEEMVDSLAATIKKERISQ